MKKTRMKKQALMQSGLVIFAYKAPKSQNTSNTMTLSEKKHTMKKEELIHHDSPHTSSALCKKEKRRSMQSGSCVPFAAIFDIRKNFCHKNPKSPDYQGNKAGSSSNVMGRRVNKAHASPIVKC